MDVMLWTVASGQDMGGVGIQRSESGAHTWESSVPKLCPPPLPPGMSRISAEKP